MAGYSSVFTLSAWPFFHIFYNDQRWYAQRASDTTTFTMANTKLFNSNTIAEGLVNLLLITSVLLDWDSEVDNLTLLILAPHQKHFREGMKCCYYQKQTFELKLHLYLIHSLTPRSNALPQSLKHLVKESFVTAWNNFHLNKRKKLLPCMLYDCLAVSVQLFTDNNRNRKAAIRAADLFSFFSFSFFSIQ